MSCAVNTPPNLPFAKALVVQHILQNSDVVGKTATSTLHFFFSYSVSADVPGCVFTPADTRLGFFLISCVVVVLTLRFVSTQVLKVRVTKSLYDKSPGGWMRLKEGLCSQPFLQSSAA